MRFPLTHAILFYTIPVYLMIGMITPIAWAQNTKIDSLRSLLKEVPEDTTDVNNMTALAMELLQPGKFDETIEVAIQARRLAEKLNFKKGVGHALLASGYSYFIKGYNDAAFKDLKEALLIFEDIKDTVNLARSHNFLAQAYQSTGNTEKAREHLLLALKFIKSTGHKKGMAVIYNDLGNSYLNSGSYEMALEYYLRSLQISKSISAYSTLSVVLNNIALIYENLEEDEKALEYYKQFLDVTERNGLTAKKALALTNIGNMYLKKNDVKQAEKYLFESLRILEENGDKRLLIDVLRKIGTLYFQLKDYKKSEQNYTKAVTLAYELDMKTSLITPLLGISELYLAKGKTDKAKKYITEAEILAKNYKSKFLEDIYLQQAKIDSARGNFKSALVYIKNYTVFHDSLTEVRKNEKIKYLTSLFEDQQQNPEQNSVLAEDKEEVWSAKNNVALAILFISVVSLTGLVTYKSIKLKHKKSELEQLIQLSKSIASNTILKTK